MSKPSPKRPSLQDQEMSFPASLIFDSMPKKKKRKPNNKLSQNQGKAKTPTNCELLLEPRQRDQFRALMVDLVHVLEFLPAEEIPIDNLDPEDERFRLYLKCGVETLHAPPLQNSILQAILCLVPYKVKCRFPESLERLIKEVKDNYIQTVRRSIVEFALNKGDLHDFSKKTCFKKVF